MRLSSVQTGKLAVALVRARPPRPTRTRLRVVVTPRSTVKSPFKVDDPSKALTSRSVPCTTSVMPRISFTLLPSNAPAMPATAPAWRVSLDRSVRSCPVMRAVPFNPLTNSRWLPPSVASAAVRLTGPLTFAPKRTGPSRTW